MIHQTKRRQVLSSADVALRQVQTIDNDGKESIAFVWICGPDVFLSETMDGMFDVNRRRRAPKWVVEQLQALPTSRQFDYRGKGKATLASVAETPVAEEAMSTVEADEDFASA